MSIQISTGNLVRYLTGCPCGRGWETDTPMQAVPAHDHEHRLVTDQAWHPATATATHTCTGCTWSVTTYQPLSDRTTAEALNQAFTQHLTEP